ncbi:MAG: S1 RNA-binding domain-containing protein [Eubacteriales bacterium]|jgi:S1 RNA binding domain protein|nr:S1 RNA-binding domain-containing protein [Eubacteriales bacterium]
MKLQVGKIVEGKVTGITNFGAFVQLPNGKTGLVHISEVALSYVKDINDHLKISDTVKAKVISVDEKGKISLSIKKAIEEQQKLEAGRPAEVEFVSKRSTAELSFEEKMRIFMQDSDERMSDLRRNMDSKRGGGYRRSSSAHV